MGLSRKALPGKGNAKRKPVTKVSLKRKKAPIRPEPQKKPDVEMVVQEVEEEVPERADGRFVFQRPKKTK